METALLSFAGVILAALIAQGGAWIINRRVRKDTVTDRRREQDDLVRTAVMVMLHDRLYQACHYYIGRGEIDEDGFDNVTALYTAYHNLGGNSTGTRLYEQVKSLPIK